MRHEDPYDLLAGGKQQGEPLLTGGELTSVRISELETTPEMIPSAATGPHNLNGLRESFRTFRQALSMAATGSQDRNGLRESFRTFRREVAGHRP